MKKEKLLENLLKEGLEPVFLKVVDDSSNHNVPKGSKTHFHAFIVSDKFSGLSLVQRHQLVHSVIAEKIKGKIHAFSQQTLTPEEFQKKGKESSSLSSPSSPCVGGAWGKE